jgi:O-antigen/teichoic acid export membrane protein
MTEQRDSRKWLGRGAWAVVDQALYAIANALLNILLARWLAPAEFGAFAVAYSAFLLIGAFHVALLIEPMLVFGPGWCAGRLAGYLDVLVRGHYVLTLAGSLLLIATSVGVWFFGSGPLAHALFGLAIAAPFTLFMWLAKRAAYVQQQTKLAAAQSVIYLVLLLTGLFALKGLHLVSVFPAMLVMSFAGVFAGQWLMRRLRAVTVDSEEPPSVRAVLAAHWTYGRWALMTGVLIWMPLNFYLVVLSTWVNLEASATLKALINLVLPLMQVNAALSALLLPILVTQSGDGAAFARLLGRALALFVFIALLYALAIAAFGGSMVQLMYGGKYVVTSRVLWLLAVIPILDGASAVLASALRSLEQPKQIFRAQIFAVICVLLVGVAATAKWGVAGATGAMVLAGGLAVALLGVSVRSASKSRRFSIRTLN